MKQTIKKWIGKSAIHLNRFALHRGCLTRDTFIQDTLKNEIVETNYGPIQFFCPGDVVLWRARTFFEKEPETLEWIDGFADNAVFWDIGANVGLYSLYAAKRNVNVSAFEPLFGNQYVLNQNIYLNALDHKITAFPIAFNDISKLDYLNIQHIALGEADNSFGQNTDWKGQPYHPLFKQASMGFSIDAFIDFFNMPAPNYIKIDVDGLESQILMGAKATLANPEVKEIMVELQDGSPLTEEIIRYLSSFDFKLQHKRHAPMFENSNYSVLYNFFFIKMAEPLLEKGGAS